MRSAFAVQPLSTLLLIVTLTLSIPVGLAGVTQSPASGTPPTPNGSALLWQVDPPEGWVRPGHGDEQSGPVIAGDVVIWPTDRLRAYDLVTGAVRWEAAPDVQTTSNSVAVAGGTIIVGVPGRIDGPTTGPDATPEPVAFSAVGLDGATGVVRWATPVEDAFTLPVADGSVVYMVVGHRQLIAIDDTSGDPLWEQAATIVPGTGPEVSDGIVAVTLDSGAVAAFSATDGTPLWTTDAVASLATPNPAQSNGYSATGPAMGGGLIVYGKGRPLPPATPGDLEDIVALDARTGEVRWQAVTDAFLYAPVTIADGMVLVQGGDAVRAFDTGTGEERWEFRTSDGQVISSPPVVSDGIVYTSGRGERVHALDATTGSLRWQANTRNGTDGPVAVSGDVVVVATWSGTIRAIDGDVVSATTDAGTPAAGGPPSADVSGLPPCTVTPREPLDLDADQPFPYPPILDGTPGVTLVEPEPDEHGLLGVPIIQLQEIPTGAPADLEIVAALDEAAARMESCARLSDDRESLYDLANMFQDENGYAALFTDDFLRRPWVGEAMGPMGYEGIVLYVPVPTIGDDVRLLSDGRVAVIVPESPLSSDGALYIFSQAGDANGPWLVDEYLLIGSSPLSRP